MDFNETIRQIKSIVPIQLEVEKSVKLKKSGSSLLGLCPFHDEKTPSFRIFPDDGRFYCFGCKAKGDVIDFLSLKENLNWMEAFTTLAENNGIELPQATQKNNNPSLVRINEIMNGLFQQQLEANPEKGLAYIKERGITNATIAAYGIGYCADSDKLIQYLRDIEQIPEGDIIETGNFYRTSFGKLRCNFQGRITFPIKNIKGEIIGFGSRAIVKGVEPKYLNTTSSTVFNKSMTLYGLYEGREAILKHNSIVVTEGFLDVLSAHQNGYKNVVATMGTAFGESHVKIIQKYTSNIIFAFDADKAGKLATYKAIDMVKENFGTKLSASVTTRGILQVGESCAASIKIAVLPEGSDVDDVVKQRDTDYDGLTLWESIMIEAMPIIDWHLHLFDKRNDYSTKEKAKFVQQLAPLILEIKSPIERDDYILQLSYGLNIDINALRSEIASVSRKTSVNSRPNLQLIDGYKEAFVPEFFEDIVIANIIKYYPNSLSIEASDGRKVEPSDFDKSENISILTKLIENAQSNSPLLTKDSLPDGNEKIHFGNLLSYSKTKMAEVQPTEVNNSIRFLINKLRKNQFQKVYDMLADELSKAETYDDSFYELVQSTIGISGLMKVYSN